MSTPVAQLMPCTYGFGRHAAAPLARVEHVEEAVLRRLHHHVALLCRRSSRSAVDDLIGVVVIPALVRRGLVVPGVFAGIELQRDDRREIQVIAAAGRADFRRPRRAVAGADVDEVGLRVVDDGIPRCAAAARLPPLAVPGLRGRFHLRVLEAFGRIAGHDEPAPVELAGLGVVGRQVATLLEFGAALADQHLALGDARRAGDGVRLARLDGADVPHHLAGGRIERDQPPSMVAR